MKIGKCWSVRLRREQNMKKTYKLKDQCLVLGKTKGDEEEKKCEKDESAPQKLET